MALIRYVERNPVRAKLVSQCENWQWEARGDELMVRKRRRNYYHLYR